MARMIPATIHPNVKSTGEKRIFRLLRDAPHTEGWIVLHSLGLARHATKRRGEIDFLILCPRGIFVLEVKGGRVKREGGIWVTVDRYGEMAKLHESPYEQAAGAMFSLERAIRKEFGASHKLSNLIFGYGVVFPNTPRIDVGTEGDRAIAYTLEDTRAPITKYIGRMASFTEAHGNSKRSRPTPDDIAKLAEFMRGDFDVVAPLWAYADETVETMLVLTKEQYSLIDLLEDRPRVVIRGAAGTGKTLISREAALRAARHGLRVLFVCFNRFLARHINAGLSNMPEYELLTVKSIYQLMDELIRSSEHVREFTVARSGADQDELYGSLYPDYASLAAMEPDFEPWDLLIVDEGQDFLTDRVIDVLDLCVRGGLESGMWRWFMDENNQAGVYGRREKGSLERLETFGVGHLLTVNCRNTAQILDETTMLTEPKMRSVARVEGRPVRYVWYASSDDQKAALERQVDRVMKDGISPDRIVVLSPRGAAECIGSRIDRTLLVPLEESDLDEVCVSGPVRYSTISAFKGLEADVVILTDVEKLQGDWWQSVLYVGMTRSRVELIVLLPERLRAIYSEKLKSQVARLERAEE